MTYSEDKYYCPYCHRQMEEFPQGAHRLTCDSLIHTPVSFVYHIVFDNLQPEIELWYVQFHINKDLYLLAFFNNKQLTSIEPALYSYDEDIDSIATFNPEILLLQPDQIRDKVLKFLPFL